MHISNSLIGNGTLIKTNKSSIEKKWEEEKLEIRETDWIKHRNCNTLVQFVIRIDFNWITFFFFSSIFLIVRILCNSIFKLNAMQLKRKNKIEKKFCQWFIAEWANRFRLSFFTNFSLYISTLKKYHTN